MYDIILVLLAIISLPKLCYQWLFHKKYRNSLGQRFGFGFPDIKKGSCKLIWIHSVSMGETRAVSSVCKKIKKQYPQAILVSSTITETGYAESLKSIPEADYHVFLPFDFLWIIKPIIHSVRPDCVILCETDFWFNFLKCSKDESAKIILVNGKLSHRSMTRFKLFSGFSKKIFKLFDFFCVQNQTYADRFLEIGVAKDKLAVTGNIKFDGEYPALSDPELKAWKQSLGIPEENFVLVAGSTHDPEEQIVLDAIKNIMQSIPNLTLLIVPRHPERFDVVAKILRQNKISFKRYSEHSPETKSIILIDAMGHLRQCYQLADIAFVGGSFTPKVGGHNIIEPSAYGVPVLYGPYMHSQPELVELVVQYQAGIQIDINEFSSTVIRLLSNKNERQTLGQSGKNLLNDLSGATERTCATIFPLLK